VHAWHGDGDACQINAMEISGYVHVVVVDGVVSRYCCCCFLLLMLLLVMVRCCCCG